MDKKIFRTLDGKELVTMDRCNQILAEMGLKQKAWSGVPVPVPGLKLVLEPRQQFTRIENWRWECFDENGISQPDAPEFTPDPSVREIVNTWWNERLQRTFGVARTVDGRAIMVEEVTQSRLEFLMNTLNASAVWPVEAEAKAQQKLQEIIPEHSFHTYQLTGSFMEESVRSKVSYMFRRGRPTLAIRNGDNFSYVLCALCLHPVGYYQDSWAGVMCPTDEVIAHLLMMRGTEEKFWANANQHPHDKPQSGI